MAISPNHTEIPCNIQEVWKVREVSFSQRGRLITTRLRLLFSQTLPNMAKLLLLMVNSCDALITYLLDHAN